MRTDNRHVAKRIYSAVQRIPKGRVATYGQVARAAKVRSPRLVGYYLHGNPDPENIPCHRVVDAQGNLSRSYAFGGLRGQKQRLQTDGVVVEKGKVRLSVYAWQISAEP